MAPQRSAVRKPSTCNSAHLRLGVLLGLAAVLCLAPTPAAGAGNATTRFQKPYNVCTSDWSPIVRCSADEDPSTYDGYQIALWRKIAEDLGWADSDWTFSCVDWTAMIDDLAAPDGQCSFAAAGVEVSLANIVRGLKFSYPIYKSGFHVLIASTVEEGGIWAFAQAFHWSVWLCLGGTAVAVSITITAAELLAGGDRAHRKGLRGWSWYCMTKLVQVTPHVGDPKTWASRLLVLGWAFMVLIMVHLFTATTASKLTMQRLANDIKSKADLPGKKVESWEPYVPLLRKYSIDATGLPWDNDEDTKTLLDNLRTHKYQALILDSPVVQYFAALAPDCDLVPVGEPFETFNLAIAYPPDAPDSLAAAVSSSIVRLQTGSATLDKLENTYIKSAGGGACSSVLQIGAGTRHSTSINLQQVLGLWYILAITLGCALLLTAASNLRRPHRRQLLLDLLLCRRGSRRPAAAAAAAAGAAAPAAELAGKAGQQQQQGEEKEGPGGGGGVVTARGVLLEQGAVCEVEVGGAGHNSIRVRKDARASPALPGVAGA